MNLESDESFSKIAEHLTVAQLMHALMERNQMQYQMGRSLSSMNETWYLGQLSTGSIWMTGFVNAKSYNGDHKMSSKMASSKMVVNLGER